MAKKVKNKIKASRPATSASNTRRRSSRRTLHYIFFILFGIAVFITLSLTVLFKIENITVTGCTKYTESEIIESSGILIGDNLFRLSASEISEKLTEQYPYIESVSIHRVFPPAIEIKIKQSIPVAVLKQKNNEYVLITQAGRVLERGNLLLSDDCLLVIGVDVKDYIPGDSLGTWNAEPRASRDETQDERTERLRRNETAKEQAEQEIEALKMMGYFFDAIKATDFHDITNLDISNRLDMQFMFENRLLVKLGSEAGLADKLLFVRIVATEHLHPMAHGTINAADLALNYQLVFAPASGYNSDGSPIAHLDEATHG